MESNFLENQLYTNPEQSFREVIDRIDLDEELGTQFKSYLEAVQAEGANVKDDAHQEAMRPILEGLLSKRKKEEAGLLFNIHRTLTEFRGYGASDKASTTDVPAAFGKELEIPGEGLIVVDLFVTRSLPEVLKILEEKKVDLSRVRAVAPKGALAAQLMGMSEDKRKEVEEALGKLGEDQIIVEDVNHVDDIKVEGDIALWFSPRTMPIHPRLHAEKEEETIDNHREAFRAKANQMVEGGRMFANLAYSEEWKPLGVETAVKKRRLTKLTGISKSVAEAVVDALLDEGFEQIQKGEFSPSDVSPETDHAKMATWLHMVKQDN